MMALLVRVDRLLGSSLVVTAVAVLFPSFLPVIGGVLLVEGVVGAACAADGMGPVELDSGGIALPLP